MSRLAQDRAWGISGSRSEGQFLPFRYISASAAGMPSDRRRHPHFAAGKTMGAGTAGKAVGQELRGTGSSGG